MKEYNICLCSDDNFTPYMEALIVSILKHSLDDEKFIFHIITLNFSDNSLKKIEYLKKIKDFEIKIHKPINLEKYTKWYNDKSGGKWSVHVFLKLDIPIILKDIERVLYIDSDMIVLGSLKEFFDSDMEGYYIGGVNDLNISKSHRNKLGIGYNTNYFNGGLILFNTKKYNEDNIPQKIEEYVNTHEKIFFLEQDILNYLLKDKIKYFSENYNFTSAIAKKHNNIENVIIPHFTLVKPLYHNTPIFKNRFYYEFWKCFVETKSFKDESLKYAIILIDQNDPKIAGHNKLIDKLSWWIPFREMRNNFKIKYKRDIKEKFE